MRRFLNFFRLAQTLKLLGVRMYRIGMQKDPNFCLCFSIIALAAISENVFWAQESDFQQNIA